MATTSTAVYPSTSLFPGTSLYPGQGSLPIIRALTTFDDANDLDPSWTDRTLLMRGGSTSRGRNDELSEFDAGNASVDFSNRSRDFDPDFHSVRPMSRVRILEEYSGEIHDLFNGYAESWRFTYDKSGADALASVQYADEFKVLALDGLPTTSPPRDSYADVIAFDNPTGYWRMGDGMPGSVAYSIDGTPGIPLIVYAGILGQGISGVPANASAIIGDTNNYATALGGGVNMFNYGYLAAGTYSSGDTGDVVGGSELTVECWVKFSSVDPVGGDNIIIGPNQSAGAAKYNLVITSTGLPQFNARSSGGTLFISTGSTAFEPNRWYHLAGTVQGGSVRVYLNGVQQAATSFGGSIFSSSLQAGTSFIIGDPVGAIGSVYYDEVAFYPFALSASRLMAHYEAGANRGFPEQAPHDRINAILAIADTNAPQLVVAPSAEPLQGRYMTGQSPLEEIRAAVAASIDTTASPDTIDAAFFADAAGVLTYLGPSHRAVSPYNTVQATFGDAGGGELPYLGIEFDYSESFLRNSWSVTRDGGETQTSSDQPSIDRYKQRPDSKTGLILTDDADALAFAQALVAKYKDPFRRVTSISPKMVDPNTAEAVYRLDLMDRIRVLWTVPFGGGARIDQTLFVQKIEHSWSAQTGIPSCTLSVSPL